MKKVNLSFLFIFFLLTFSLYSASLAVAQGNSNNRTVENEELSIRITSNENVPKYEFWAPGENSTSYRVQFVGMFEAEDDGDDLAYTSGTDRKVSSSQQSLSSWNWEFSEISEENGDTNFNLTGSPSSSDLEVTFVNHIGGDSSSFKFDVIINNYEFISDTAMLVLAFRLNSPGNNDAEQDDNTSEFGDGYMEIEETASAGGDDIGVGLSTKANGTNTAFLAYEHFSGDLVHDPTLGIRTNYTIYFIAGGVILLVVGLVLYSRRKKE